SLDQKVLCLEIGADDYMVKPIEGRELVARIKALVRRQVPGRANTLLCGDLGYDLQTRQFSLAGAPLPLPPRERALLETLMLKQGSTVPKQTLLDGLFDLGDEAGVDALELYVHRLRKKLDASQATIITLRGVGYLLRLREGV
ncbi:response regulator transcription factor, partial [Ottowia sp.]|uniref:winged helix-turn-helix domain-containing protein n=1 Tax=Ottowia sp. TaxID=1898956 RepID=UPI0025FD6BC6